MPELTCGVTNCGQSAAITEPIALCDDHILELASVIFPRIIAAAALGTPTLSQATRVLNISATLHGAHEPVVYFIANGNRLKIGTSENLVKRVASLSLRPTDLRLLLSGNQTLERALHQRFAAQRIGGTEWFDYTGDLARYVEAMQSRAPMNPLDTALPGEMSLPDQMARRLYAGADARRALIFDIVADAGAEGIETAQVLRAFRERYPNQMPPHRATVITWLSEDERIWKPSGQRGYSVVSSLDDDTITPSHP